MDFKPNFGLDDWQIEARDAWLASKHPTLGLRHGIADVYTGAGKTFLAFGCMIAAKKLNPRLKFAVVCPTSKLAEQWVDELRGKLTIARASVGMVGGEYDANFAEEDIVVYVLDSARELVNGRSRLARDAAGHEVMLVVDECHRTGANASSRIYDTKSWARLGLSATSQRSGNDDCDEDGRPLPVERQLHGMAIGPVFFRFSLKDGDAKGMLPRFEVHHHAVHLTKTESAQYADHEDEIRKKTKALDVVGDAKKWRAYLNGRNKKTTPAQRTAAKALENAYYRRKMFLYKASERLRVARVLAADAWASSEPPSGAMLFNERIGDTIESDAADEADGETQAFGATTLHELLVNDAKAGRLPMAASRILLEHGSLPSAVRSAAIKAFKAGEADILVTVKALQEGIDVPHVSMGVSVASTSSARQRIQTMGRILRLPRGDDGKRKRPEDVPVKHLHMIYVNVEPDKRIYTEKDWNAETGEQRNHWWSWPAGGSKQVGEPLKPDEVGTERGAWDEVKGRLPARWRGPTRGAAKYTWRHDSIIKVINGVAVTNDVEVKTMLGKLGEDRKGPFAVTPELHVVLKWNKAEDCYYAHGRLTEALLLAGESAEPDFVVEEVVTPSEGGTEASTLAAFPQAARGYDRVAAEAADLHDIFGAYWYELLQFACRAAAQGDLDTLRATRQLAASRQSGRAGHVVAFATAALAGEPEASERAELEEMARIQTGETLHRGYLYPALLKLAGQAHAAGVTALVQHIAGAFKLRAAREARAKRGRAEALVNAMYLLAGANTAILSDTEGD